MESLRAECCPSLPVSLMAGVLDHIVTHCQQGDVPPRVYLAMLETFLVVTAGGSDANDIWVRDVAQYLRVYRTDPACWDLQAPAQGWPLRGSENIP